ncbi:MAG: hypothetical protein WBV82_22660 [Myxococcaceae bacterium]
MSKWAILWTACGVAVLAGGCAAQRAQGPQIKDEWVARVPPEKLKPVNQARDERRAAEDDATRARVAVNDAENQVSVKKAIKSAAYKRVDAANKAVHAAEQTGDQKQIQQAQASLQDAEMQRNIADAELKVAQVQYDLAKEEHAFADTHVKTQNALLEQAEYQALKDSGDTRVQDLDPLEFERAISEAKNSEREAQIRVSDEQSQLASAEQALNDARKQTGVGGAGPDGEEELLPLNPPPPKKEPQMDVPLEEDTGTFEFDETQL